MARGFSSRRISGKALEPAKTPEDVIIVQQLAGLLKNAQVLGEVLKTRMARAWVAKQLPAVGKTLKGK